jgi:histidyl-tRNA synthetase
LDKWDKIGEEKVREELVKIISEDKASRLLAVLEIRDFAELTSIDNEELKHGIEELEFIFKHSKSKNLKFDLRLLRGLDYYTGTVLEVVSAEMEYGSVCGGGRYDELTELFGLKDMSGIGVSFGLDRVYDVMTELGRFPEEENKKKILILNLTENAAASYFSLLTEIRHSGMVVDLYPNVVKMDKQLVYADKCGYTHAILIGEDELAKNQIQIKNLKERKQKSVPFGQVLEELQEVVSNL